MLRQRVVPRTFHRNSQDLAAPLPVTWSTRPPPSPYTPFNPALSTAEARRSALLAKGMAPGGIAARLVGVDVGGRRTGGVGAERFEIRNDLAAEPHRVVALLAPRWKLA